MVIQYQAKKIAMMALEKMEPSTQLEFNLDVTMIALKMLDGIVPMI